MKKITRTTEETIRLMNEVIENIKITETNTYGNCNDVERIDYTTGFYITNVDGQIQFHICQEEDTYFVDGEFETRNNNRVIVLGEDNEFYKVVTAAYWNISQVVGCEVVKEILTGLGFGVLFTHYDKATSKQQIVDLFDRATGITLG